MDSISRLKGSGMRYQNFDMEYRVRYGLTELQGVFVELKGELEMEWQEFPVKARRTNLKLCTDIVSNTYFPFFGRTRFPTSELLWLSHFPKPLDTLQINTGLAFMNQAFSTSHRRMPSH
jgi:hypothetical protein